VTKKIKKTDGSILWGEDSATVLRKIRAYYPWPGSAFRVPSKGGFSLIKITEAKLAEGSGEPGHSIELGKRWIVACGTGAIEILKVIPEGSREMNAGDYLRGFGGKTEHLENVLDGPPAAGTV
jgi:methionyl-tRNA formyltransferase